MRQKPERLAWTVLLAAFALFCSVTVACPLSVRSYLRSARRPLRVQVNVQLGTLRIERGGSSQVDATAWATPRL